MLGTDVFSDIPEPDIGDLIDQRISRRLTCVSIQGDEDVPCSYLVAFGRSRPEKRLSDLEIH